MRLAMELTAVSVQQHNPTSLSFAVTHDRCLLSYDPPYSFAVDTL